jgi:lipid A 4'-phosphatase
LGQYYQQLAGALRPVWTSNWIRVTSYLRLRRSRVLLTCFLLSSVTLATFSHVDLRIAALFYDGGFYMARQGWTRVLHGSVPWFIIAALVAVAGSYVFNRFARRNLFEVDGRKLVYLLLVLVLGAGLAVNAILKDNFGRARPRDVEEFGGTLQFTPAFFVSSECDYNCSFASGDAAGAFFGLAFVLASSRRRAASAAGIGFGVLVSVARIASGAHWFSDTIVSFFVMLIVADALYYQMFVFSPAAVEAVPDVGPPVLVEP